MWIQQEVVLDPRPRGFHLVTDEVERGVPELLVGGVGLAHVFIRHTSASLTAERERLARRAPRLPRRGSTAPCPDGADYFAHTLEGPDDMPAHIKSSLLGPSLTLPVRDGRLALGTWQGIYLCEHRDSGGARKLTVTLTGESQTDPCSPSAPYANMCSYEVG